MKKKITATILALTTLISSTSVVLADYPDVSSDAWYYSYVNDISELKGFSGYEDGTFRPDNIIMQEEFLKTVMCLIDGEQPALENYTPTYESWDSYWDAWAQPYLTRALELGIVTESDKMFTYSGIPCTRGNMAKIITRAVEYLKEEPVQDTSVAQGKIKEFASIEEEYKPYILQAYAKGILNGYEDGTFRYDGFLTRAEASAVIMRMIDPEERIKEEEKLYDYFGRKVKWDEPLRTDVPEEYQVSIADHEVIDQANYDEAVALGGSITTRALNRSKSMMFEDLVLQSITYEGDTLKLTVPDYLPESQRWEIGIAYWDITEDYNFMNIKGIEVTEPGEYSFDGIVLLADVSICVKPKEETSFESLITVTYQQPLSLERYETPRVDFNNISSENSADDFEWIQGQGYKDYVKDYAGEFLYEIDW